MDTLLCPFGVRIREVRLYMYGDCYNSSLGRSRPLLLRISSAHAIHWSRTCHVIFKRAHRVENSTKYRADDLCVNLLCEYFCSTLGDPHFFFGRSLPFLTLAIILKNKKKSVRGKFLLFLIFFLERVELVHGYRCA